MLKISSITKKIEIIFDKPDGTFQDVKHYGLCNDKLITNFDYFGDSEKILMAYGLNSPIALWQKELPALTGEMACNTNRNIVYVPTDPYLYALNAETGEEIWRYQGFGEIYNPSVANGIIYFVSDTNMYAIDENNGEKLFSYPLETKADETTQIAISDGMLYFSGSGGTCGLFSLGLPASSTDVNPSSDPSSTSTQDTLPVLPVDPRLGEIPIDYYRNNDTGDVWGDSAAWRLSPPAGNMPSNMWEYGLRSIYLAKYACWDRGVRDWMPANIARGIYYCTNPEDRQEVINYLRALADEIEVDLREEKGN
jgi:hypothetical protein